GAKHTGAFQGIPATGREVTVSNNEIDRIVDGKIVEQWVGLDMLSLMQQLGVVPTPGHGAMSTERNKAIVVRWRDEIWNKRNVQSIDELHGPDFVGHYIGVMPEPIRGREALKQLFIAYLAAFDIDVTPEFFIAEGDMVVVHDSNRVKHTGEFQGIPATGREMSVTSTDTYRILGGKIVEQWLGDNLTGFMAQACSTPG